MHFTIRDYCMGVVVALTWGMGIVFAKAAIEHFPPMLLMALRSALTAIVLIWFVRIPRKSIVRIAIIAAVSGTLQFSLTLTGLLSVGAGVAALITQLEIPFLVLLGFVFLNERPSHRTWLGIVVAIFGVFIVTGTPQIFNSWMAVILIAGGSLAWAVGQVMVRALDGVDGLTLVAWVAVFAAPQLLVSSAIFETGQLEAIKSAGWVVWAAVVYLGLVMTALGYGMWYTLVRNHPVSKVAPFLLLLPVFSILGGVLFLGESLTFHTLLGGIIIIGGVAFITLEKKSDEDIGTGKSNNDMTMNTEREKNPV